jgi:hypothetical protein
LTLPERSSSARRSSVASVTGSRNGIIESSSNSSASRSRCALGSVKTILRIAVNVTASNLSQSQSWVKSEGRLVFSTEFPRKDVTAQDKLLIKV